MFNSIPSRIPIRKVRSTDVLVLLMMWKLFLKDYENIWFYFCYNTSCVDCASEGTVVSKRVSSHRLVR